jgi:hypothetical protein
MSHSPDDTQLEQWHRWFAAECNNRAWAQTTGVRTREDQKDLLNAAHASAFHWGAVGTELNRMRALMLLAHVHALVGHGPMALSYAREVHGYFVDGDTPDWELAFAHAILAQAAHAAGDGDTHAQAYSAARIAVAAIADPEDRKIVEETFALVPQP